MAASTQNGLEISRQAAVECKALICYALTTVRTQPLFYLSLLPDVLWFDLLCKATRLTAKVVKTSLVQFLL
jgi:hypothetical protein